MTPNREDITRMAREAGLSPVDFPKTDSLKRFAALVRAAEREKVAAWMLQRGYATGHGDTVDDLLKELEWQIAENWTNALVKGVEGEREACANIDWTPVLRNNGMVTWGDAETLADLVSAAIRARGNT